MTAAGSSSSITPNVLSDIVRVCWGTNVKEDIFVRWTQGFQFSLDEPTALVQYEGGPCAVLAPAQAFILKYIIQNVDPVNDNWRTIEQEDQNKLLVHAVVEMLKQAVDSNTFHIVYIDATEASSPDYSFDQFHSQIKVQSCSSCDEVEQFYNQRIDLLYNRFGVLLFLYSVLYSKGLARLRLEVSDITEPLIDREFGYGSQSLINLMITGRAVNYVFDHVQDIDGLQLQGINQQSQIGFLTLLEHLRYCEVGSYLKNPINPVWVLGSETHLTVTFSFEKRLACLESSADKARRVFKMFDPDGNNFIASDHLQNLLAKLDLVSDINYVDIMRKKLDPDELGIILLSAFMDEFFGDPEKPPPDMFDIFHYNGLARSNYERKVMYRMAHCVLLECNINCLLETNPMLTCLQTKWPSIELSWVHGVTPSLN
ncbi:ubiquitin carboxyl-terminal hydrolase MINDY-3 homolog [Diaphorina citri]|uniref:Ubiquitin carboxyl-terminal hydrolase MINDY n=1 Tax=Diaphorina citri TaxID=121845 RepID=A0A1S3CWF9_DIACI|nr:ubiquitin carboxyl-terminal hydrolase MINDY-3 homolog [Diaphorina citri]KAI5713140.1 hypothetical protein M8J75_013995 [Diaphorina citri]KAI5750467.1 hypothetical protein M8J76_015778 [Diaphorina citri]KAI5755740.1 hypothetical protein M8J77_019304 [Diaphorina citri]